MARIYCPVQGFTKRTGFALFQEKLFEEGKVKRLRGGNEALEAEKLPQDEANNMWPS